MRGVLRANGREFQAVEVVVQKDNGDNGAVRKIVAVVADCPQNLNICEVEVPGEGKWLTRLESRAKIKERCALVLTVV